MPQPLRVAVVGAGHIGRYHADKYARAADARLVAVVDTDADRAGALAAEHGARAAGRVEAVLDAVDAVSVCAPTEVHEAIALACLDAGRHVLVEKPIAETLAGADRLISRAAARGAVLQVGHLERFSLIGLGVPDWIDRPLEIEARRLTPFRGRSAGVSVVFDLMIHDIDLVHALVPAPLRSVEATGARLASSSEDFAIARLVFADGTVAHLTASRVSPVHERSLRVHQASGLVAVDLLERRAARSIRNADGGIGVDTVERADADPLGDEIAAFLAAIRTGARPVVPGEDGRRALATAIRIRAAIDGAGSATARFPDDRPADRP